MDFDPVFLSRLQFAFTIMFHYIFPPLTIGLGGILVFMEGMYLKTKNPIYESMTKFWVKIFAVNFALGVASGIVMEFQFGTNWSTYSRFVGDVFGSALAAEGIFAFFLESGFLAVLVFGWDRVSARVHFFSTVMVALGAMFSAVWIVVANSWQQTPAGHHLVAQELMTRAEILSFWAMVFNPSSMARLLHVLIGAYILSAFVVMSISAFYILKGRHLDFARRSFQIALIVGVIASIAQLPAGHWSGVIAAKHQPAKMAAFEGVFKTAPSTPIYLFGWPDEEAQKVRFGLAIPGMLSFLVHNDFETPVTGLDQIPREDWPPLGIPFQTYHLMISLGMYFIGLSLLGLLLLIRGTLFSHRWVMWVFVLSVVLPYIANQAGWVAAEVGRQPWIVYGLLRTSEAASPSVGAGSIVISLVLFGIIYTLLFAMFVFVLDRKIRRGPEAEDGEPPLDGGLTGWIDAAARRGKTQYGMAEESE